MKPWIAAGRVAWVLTLVLAAGCTSLSGRVSMAADPALFDDKLFAAPAAPVSVASIFELSPPMREFLAAQIEPQVRRSGAQLGLVDALYNRSLLQLHYQPDATRNASEAFAHRSGNCMSLVIMTAAFAREIGLPVQFRRVLTDTTVSRRGGLQLESGHVNLSLGRKMGDGRRALDKDDEILVDFLPSEQVRGHRAEQITETTLVAMYLTNRAAEALADGAHDDAYAWARAAVQHAPDFAAAYNPLALAYWRRGHMAQAELALRHGLRVQPDQTALLSNLVGVLKTTGRNEEAQVVAQRLMALEPYPPFHFFDLGMAALRQGDARTARDWFARELARADDHAEFHYWMAVAQARLGELRQARQHLNAAVEFSSNASERGLYAGKLQRLTGSSGR